MRQNPHVRICGGPGSATTLVYPTAKHGGHGTRGWRKLHLGVNRSGVIVAQALTDATTDDALTGITLVGAVEGNVASVTADPAYDTIAFYDAATEHGAQVVVPPAKTARLSQRRPRSRARDDPKDYQDGAAPVEEGGGIPSPGARGERLLSVQVDSRRSTSRPDSRSARGRIGACVQRAQSDDRAWSTRVVRDQSVTNLRVGSVPCQFRFTQQRLIETGGRQARIVGSPREAVTRTLSNARFGLRIIVKSL